MVNTMYRWITSLKNTAAVARSIPTPTEKTSANSNGSGISNNLQVKPTFNTNITTRSATKENSKLTKANRHFWIGKIYFGIYTLRISAPEFKMEVIALFVASVTKLKTHHPVR